MTRPRIGFLGTGWIGRHRMAAMAATGLIEVAAICDPDQDCAEAAAQIAPNATIVPTFNAMLDAHLDGIVIATPSALHARQSMDALARGMAVFCQKPLGRSGAEVDAVIDAARKVDRLLGLDLSYRQTAALRSIAQLVRAGELGKLFAIDLTFHNAYGPDKPWFYDPAQSGGGCAIDLGVHLIDLALWVLGFPHVSDLSSTLLAQGRPVTSGEVEDYAIAAFKAADVQIRLACSWRLHAGVDAQIEAAFYGTQGGAALRNVGGSFYDFTAHRFTGTAAQQLAAPPDDWGGRAAIAWAEMLVRSNQFDRSAADYAASAHVLDRIYGR